MRTANNRIEYKVGSKIGECVYLMEMPTIIDGGGQQRREAKFLCRCGKEFVAKLNHVKYGVTNSCGCYQLKRISESLTIHGMANTPEYDAWNHLKGRCNNPKDSQYKNYGGRGIKVCPEWEHDFEQFFKDMGKRPSSKHSIERKNNDKDYTKNNCIWEVQKNQCRNRRSNIIIEYNGESKTLIEWSESLNMGYSLLRKRIKVFNWTPKEAFTTPIIRENRYVNRKN